jgi:hypothetical protein
MKSLEPMFVFVYALREHLEFRFAQSQKNQTLDQVKKTIYAIIQVLIETTQ